MNNVVANVIYAIISRKGKAMTNKIFWLDYFVKFTGDLKAKEKVLGMTGLTKDISLSINEASMLIDIISEGMKRESMSDHILKCRGCVHLDAIGRCLSFITAKDDYSCWQGNWDSWIPVELRKPDTTHHILVTVKWSNDDYEVMELDYGVTKYNAEHFDDVWSKDIIKNIIAWRPIPEPYKE